MISGRRLIWSASGTISKMCIRDRFIDCGITREEEQPTARTMDWEQDAGIIFPAVNKIAGFETRGRQTIPVSYTHLTQPIGKQNQGGNMTKEQIEAIKDTSERQAAIANNLHLFGKTE